MSFESTPEIFEEPTLTGLGKKLLTNDFNHDIGFVHINPISWVTKLPLSASPVNSGFLSKFSVLMTSAAKLLLRRMGIGSRSSYPLPLRPRLGENLFNVNDLRILALDQQCSPSRIDRRHRKNDHRGDHHGGKKDRSDLPFVLRHNLPIIAQVGGIPCFLHKTSVGHSLFRISQDGERARSRVRRNFFHKVRSLFGQIFSIDLEDVAGTDRVVVAVDILLAFLPQSRETL